MGRILKALVFLFVISMAGLAGYAYFGDIEPQTRQVKQPVVLDVR